MSEKAFNIPAYEYFSMGGKYSGCKRGTKNDDFNFRITPAEKITVQTWIGVLCFEKSTVDSEAEFDMSEEGFAALCDYIEEKFLDWTKEHEYLSPNLGYRLKNL